MMTDEKKQDNAVCFNTFLMNEKYASFEHVHVYTCTCYVYSFDPSLFLCSFDQFPRIVKVSFWLNRRKECRNKRLLVFDSIEEKNVRMKDSMSNYTVPFFFCQSAQIALYIGHLVVWCTSIPSYTIYKLFYKTVVWFTWKSICSECILYGKRKKTHLHWTTAYDRLQCKTREI